MGGYLNSASKTSCSRVQNPLLIVLRGASFLLSCTLMHSCSPFLI